MNGRYSTLQWLDAARNDPSKHPHRRMEADRAMRKILRQMRDRHLMRLRERLIKATRAGDQHEVWKIENHIRYHERNYEAIETEEYTGDLDV